MRPPKIRSIVRRAAEVDRLLSESRRDRTGIEVARSVERRWIRRLRGAADVHAPAGDAGLEGGIGEPILIGAGHARCPAPDRQSRSSGWSSAIPQLQRIRGSRQARRRRTEAAQTVGFTDVVPIECRSERMRTLLPVQDILEVDQIMHDLAGTGCEQIVVVAEEASPAVVDNIQIVTGLGQHHVVQHLDVRSNHRRRGRYSATSRKRVLLMICTPCVPSCLKVQPLLSKKAL